MAPRSPAPPRRRAAAPRRPSSRPAGRRRRHVSLAIGELTAHGTPSPEAIHQFLTANRFPLLEGATTTFVFQGRADEVHLRHFSLRPAVGAADEAHRGHRPLVPRRGGAAPLAHRVQDRGGPRRNGSGSRIRSTRIRARDPFGANSVLHGDGLRDRRSGSRADPRRARPLDDASGRRASPSARTRRWALPAGALPPLARSYPLLVVHDGHDYLRYASLKTVLDNLIHRLEIPELIVALTTRPTAWASTPTTSATRLPHRGAGAHLEPRFPLCAARRALPDGRQLRRVASLSTACRYPGFYGRLLLQSGSFAFTDIGDATRAARSSTRSWSSSTPSAPRRPAVSSASS